MVSLWCKFCKSINSLDGDLHNIMTYLDPFDGNKAGVLAKFTFKRLPEDGRGWNDEEALEGNAWVWITDDSDVVSLKAHSSFIGTRLLKDERA